CKIHPPLVCIEIRIVLMKSHTVVITNVIIEESSTVVYLVVTRWLYVARHNFTSRPRIEKIKTGVTQLIWELRQGLIFYKRAILGEAWVETLELSEIPDAFVDAERISERGMTGDNVISVSRIYNQIL